MPHSIILGPRDFATFRHVWVLSKPERDKLDKYFQLRSTASRFVEAVDYYYDTHPACFRDTLMHDTFHLEIEYAGTSLMQIEEKSLRLPQLPLLISVRINYDAAFAVALVKEQEAGDVVSPKAVWLGPQPNEINKDQNNGN